MPRTVSLAAMRGALAQENPEVWLTLLVIDHPDLPDPLYFVDGVENVTSGGEVHTAFPFAVVLPSDESEREPSASLTISNVDRSLIDIIRSISAAPTMEFRLALASSPNTIEYGPVRLKARGVSYNAQAITFELGFDAFETEPLPWVKFTPEFFPGMFG